MQDTAIRELEVQTRSLECTSAPVEVNASIFTGESGVTEYHLMLRPTRYGSLAQQLEWLSAAYCYVLRELSVDSSSCVFRRVFCSDLCNQADSLETHALTNPMDPSDLCAVSWVSQPPAHPAKIALWAYHVTDPRGALEKTKVASLSLKRGELTHIWTAGMVCPDEDSAYTQTKGIFRRYQNDLNAQNMTLADNVVRTWFFVQNIDANYNGLVTARKEFFAQHGLTPDTHFIASTGIEGGSADVSAKVIMDAYAIEGLRQEQVKYLCAPDYLSPTHIYGVTFERGVSIDYRDRRHIFISGTASIDSAGKIAHQGNVLKQLDRTLENVEALLHQAGATLADSTMFIAYVRDPSDIPTVQTTLKTRLSSTPCQTVTAPVCRPGWLVEVECAATIRISDSQMPPL